MKDSAIVKVVAICGLVAIEIANLLTVNVDSAVIGAISATIGGIAGYEFRGAFKKGDEE